MKPKIVAVFYYSYFLWVYVWIDKKDLFDNG